MSAPASSAAWASAPLNIPPLAFMAMPSPTLARMSAIIRRVDGSSGLPLSPPDPAANLLSLTGQCVGEGERIDAML